MYLDTRAVHLQIFYHQLIECNNQLISTMELIVNKTGLNVSYQLAS